MMELGSLITAGPTSSAAPNCCGLASRAANHEHANQDYHRLNPVLRRAISPSDSDQVTLKENHERKITTKTRISIKIKEQQLTNHVPLTETRSQSIYPMSSGKPSPNPNPGV